MFLEEKLNNVLEQHKNIKEKYGVDANRSVDLLNAMIDHVAERLTIKMSIEETLQLVKQTDNIWRSFAKKNNLNPNFFRYNYIIPRLGKRGYAIDYFNITKQELEKYGQN
jgi:patatin-like phospholipase/acyl hydrolase